ncbi:MAG TPA: 6-phosphogluconolactonase [Patescibacteria group bacterium]
MDIIQKILTEKNALHHLNEGITIVTVSNSAEGISLAKDILYAVIDNKTVLYLSGGKTPQELYKKLATEEKLIAGAVGMVDERFGPKLHQTSNEKAVQATGLLRYLHARNISFYPILQNNSRQETAENYDEKLRTLNATYPKSLAILGIGADGHTAGIAGNRTNEFQNPLFAKERKYLLASEFEDAKGSFKERVTMTFWGLGLLDLLLVLTFGAEKQNALLALFEQGSEKDLPARFFKRPEVAKKTLLITDQRI